MHVMWQAAVRCSPLHLSLQQTDSKRQSVFSSIALPTLPLQLQPRADVKSNATHSDIKKLDDHFHSTQVHPELQSNTLFQPLPVGTLYYLQHWSGRPGICRGRWQPLLLLCKRRFDTTVCCLCCLDNTPSSQLQRLVWVLSGEGTL